MLHATDGVLWVLTLRDRSTHTGCSHAVLRVHMAHSELRVLTGVLRVRMGYSGYSYCAIAVLTQDAPMRYSGYTWRTQNSEYSEEYSEYAWGYSGYSHCAIAVLTQDAHMPYSGYAWRTQNSEYSQEYSEYAWGYSASHGIRQPSRR